MDILRIERMVALHGTPRGSPGPGHIRPRAGPSRDNLGPPVAMAERKQSEAASSSFDHTSVRLSYDKEIGRIVMQVLDKDSATVVKQLPPDEVVAFLKRFRKAVALLVDTTA